MGILDAPNRTVSPYDTLEIFAFTPFKTNITQFNSITFTLPDALFYMDGTTGVEIDFDDGAGFRSLSKGGSISIYYATEGFKCIRAKITTSGGIRTAQCMIDYQRPQTYTAPDYVLNIEADPVYTNDADYLDTGGMYRRDPVVPCGNSFYEQLLCKLKPSANIYVENGCDKLFDKPIIVVEGFDPDGELTIEALRGRFQQYKFISTMQGYGYDFVFVDFTKNKTYIENNAKVLEAVINWVNQNKTGTNKSTIIGFSMGGLVARWCLKDMEDRGLTHNVENYFSYDAPQQGANIPLGMQYIFKEMVRDMPYLKWNNKLSKLDDAFNSAAARQMLVTHADYNNGAFNWFPKLYTLNPLRAAFAERLKNKGYPQQTNNYGIALGRGDNTAFTKDAGNGNQFTAANPFGPQTQIFGGSVGLLLVNLEAQGYAVPENNNKATIAYYSFAGLTFRKIFGIPIAPVLTLRVRRFDYTGQYPYDDGQGSFEQTQTEFANSWISGFGMPGTTEGHDGHNFVATVSALDLQNQTYNATTKWQSANIFYNIDNQIQNPGQVGGNTLITSSMSPFDAVMTSTSECSTVGCSSPEPYLDENGNWIFPSTSNHWNDLHNTAITYQVAQFIERNILNAQPVNCAGANGLCNSNPLLSGPDKFCTNAQYQLSDLPSGITIEWISDNGKFQIISGQGTPQVTISKNTSGIDLLKAVIKNACGASLTLSKSIVIGIPEINDFDFLTDNRRCISHSGQPYYFGVGFNGQQGCSLNTAADISEVEWQIISPNPYTLTANSGVFKCSQSSIVNNAGIAITTSMPTNPYVITLRFRVKNSCGWSSWSVGNYQFIQPCNPMWLLEVSPNPVTTFAEVSIKPNSAEKQKEISIDEIQITDQLGTIIEQFKFSDGSISKSLDMNFLKPGAYFLRIKVGNEWQSRIIIKK